MARHPGRRPPDRPPVALLGLAVLVLVALVPASCGSPPPVTGPSSATSPSPVATSSGAASPLDARHLGSVGPGGRLDGDAMYIATGPDTRAYTFDITGPGGRLRVSLDLSNRDDCVDLTLWDPQETAVAAMAYDRPLVCPSSRQSGQMFDIELSVPEAAAGRWRAVVAGNDVVELSLRIRVSLTDTVLAPSGSPTTATASLYPDLVPWLPWGFGFAAPASDHPGTANDRDNGPRDPTVS